MKILGMDYVVLPATRATNRNGLLGDGDDHMHELALICLLLLSLAKGETSDKPHSAESNRSMCCGPDQGSSGGTPTTSLCRMERS